MLLVFAIVVLGTGLALLAWPRQIFEAQSRAWNRQRRLRSLYTARQRARPVDVLVLGAMAVAYIVLALWTLY